MSNAQLVDLHLEDDEDRVPVYAIDDLEVRRVRLPAGGALPPHNANSNVLLVVLEGAVSVAAEGEQVRAERGQAVSVAYQARMEVTNASDDRCTFLVLKTPHPKQMQLRQCGPLTV